MTFGEARSLVGPHITPRAVAEDLLDELRHRRVIRLQFGARVDVVMRRVVLAIGVEPRLDAFGPVLNYTVRESSHGSSCPVMLPWVQDASRIATTAIRMSTTAAVPRAA